MSELKALLDEGIRERVFEQASVAVYRSGALVVCDGSHDSSAVYDVASVTKVVTATLTLRYADLEQEVLPSLTVGQLLSHQSGLRAWRPYFALAARELGVTLPQLIGDAGLQIRAKEITQALIAKEPRDAPRPTYSDLNFLALGGFLESVAKGSLHDLAARDLFATLGLASMRWGGQNANAVRTGRGRPRAGNPAVEIDALSATSFDADAIDFAADDDNAAVMGGLTGHAGLWSNAADLAKLGDALRQCAEGTATLPLPQDRALRLFERAIGTRTYGLDTPSGESPSIGSILGRGTKGAAGHLGFTGCSLWIDRDAELSIALLTNAVAVERPNPRLRSFRPRVHDLVGRIVGAGR